MTDNQLKELLNSLTLEEKIGQMFQGNAELVDSVGEATGLWNMEQFTDSDRKNLGSILNVYGKKRLKEIQKKHLEHNKIPLMFMGDIIYGYKETFPISLGMACSFDMDLIEKSARITASEAVEDGINVNFSPMVDITRNAKWGRCAEGYGEDVLLTSRCGEAMVKGYQGNSIGDDDTLVSCVKHFAGYGATIDGKDYNSVDMSDRLLHSVYLPSYKAAIDAGAKMVMSSFNTINGEAITASKKYLKNLLRDEWGFNDVIISDYSAVDGLITEGAAENAEKACKYAVDATLDIDMMDNVYSHNIEKLIESGELSIEQIDDCVMRILRCKNALGILDDPYKYLDETKPDNNDYEANYEFAKKAVYESSVLLKNDEILPIDESKKIAVIGPYVDEIGLDALWSDIVKQRRMSVPINAAIEKISGESFVGAEKGCPMTDEGDIKDTIFINNTKPFENEKEAFERAIELAKKSEVVVMTLGESTYHHGESRSRTSISVPECQMDLFRAVYEVNKNIVVILITGRPLEICEISEKAKAVLNVWFPGTAGGEAIADMVYGKAAPSGKLSMTFPRSIGQVPLSYSELHTNHGRSEDGKNAFHLRWVDNNISPLYPFGYGLTYTKFEYSDFKLSADKMTRDEKIIASVKITNKGSFDGEEIVQMYINDPAAKMVSRPMKELKDFKRVAVKAGSTVEVSFEIDNKMLEYYTIDNEFASENGEFRVFIGASSADNSLGYKSFILE